MSNDPATQSSNTPAGTIVKRVVLALVVVYLVAFVAMNSDDVRVNFVFFEATTSLVVALVIAGVLGAVVGWALSAMRRRRRG